MILNEAMLRVRVVVVAAALGACASTKSYNQPPPPVPEPIAASDVEVSVFLLGDAGEPRPDMAPLLQTLAEDAARSAASAEEAPRIVFLGDNVYERGFPVDADAAKLEGARRRIDPQLAAVKTGGAIGLFTAGNHDWENKGARGWEAMIQQTEYVEANGGLMMPANGCPGPAVHDVGRHLSLVFLDTQWWLHDNEKPGEASAADCTETNKAEVVADLRVAMARADRSGREVIVAGHHPLRTGGRHGGYWTVGDHIFLPEHYKWYHTIPALAAAGIGIATGEEVLIGVAALIQFLPPLAHIYGRRFITSKHQDVFDSWYRGMVDSLRVAFADHPPLVYAAGHDHSLQVFSGQIERYNLVSGAGSPDKLTAAKRLDDTICKQVRPGYMRLDFLKGPEGQVVLTLVSADGDGKFSESCRMYLKRQAGSR